ncbi:MAG: hypothetical protein NTV94_15420 [Planctomycetota bacterium]|nr:hypothetical protein [Planctomycetota bacterium]
MNPRFVHTSRPGTGLRRRGVALLLASLVSFSLVQTAPAQISTAFTYQGQLKSIGSTYTGSADVRIRLFPSLSATTQIGPTLEANDVACDGGNFSVLLDFLQAVPGGAAIELSVRTPHDPTNRLLFTTLSPRQLVTGAPQAYRAEESSLADSATVAANALKLGGQLPSFYQDVSNFTTGTLASGRLSGNYTQGVGFTNPGNAFAGSGAGLTALHAGNIATGILSPARGGTGSSIASATVGNVLKWTGSAFTAQPETAYLAGTGLSLSGTTFSIPDNAITSAMLLNGSISNLDLASDAASLGKVSGGALTISGGSALLGTATPSLTIQSSTNGGSARLDLFETVSTGVGGRLAYDGANNLMQLGTVDNPGGPFINAMTISRGSANVAFAGAVSASSFVIPTTTRSVMVSATAFRPVSYSQPCYIDYDGVVNASTTPGWAFFVAPVNIPDGATITNMTAFVFDNSVSPMSVELVALSQPSQSFTRIGSIDTTGSVAGVRAFSTGPLSSVITASSQSLSIRAYWPDVSPQSSLVLVSVRVTYTIDNLLP